MLDSRAMSRTIRIMETARNLLHGGNRRCPPNARRFSYIRFAVI